MDDHRFDALARSLTDAPSRRGVLRRLAAATLGLAAIHLPAAVEARKKGKKRCPKGRRCGTNKRRCCEKGQLCSGGRCVTGQGSCPAGANFCLDGTTTCNGNPDCICTGRIDGGTRCAFTINAQHECGECVDDAGCVAKFGGAAFCILGGPSCGCLPGEGICATACPG